MVGGCMLDAAGDGKGAICQLSSVGGVALMRTAPVVLEGALRPDLRHWEHVPAAFVVTSASRLEPEPCLSTIETAVQRLWSEPYTSVHQECWTVLLLVHREAM